jgi:GAF domain-containing protein/anti-sigma regulatory factor (Ser/Thr protein kinase)
MSEPKTVWPVFAAFVSELQDEIRADVVTAHLYDRRDDIFYHPVGVGLYDSTTFAKRPPRTDRLAGKIVKRRSPLFTNDALTDPLFGGAFVNREHIHSSVGIPLIRGDEVVGVVFAGYRERGRVSTEHVVRIQAAAARHLVLLGDEDPPVPSPQRARLAPHASRLDFLVRQGCNITSSPTVVWSGAPGDHSFVIRAATGLPARDGIKTISASEPSLLTHAIRQDKPVCLTADDPRVGTVLSEEARLSGWQTLIAVPLSRVQQQKAVLCLFPFVRRSLGDWELTTAILELAFQIEEVLRDEWILESLGLFGIALDRRGNLSDVVPAITQYSVRLFGAGAGSFHPYDAECAQLGQGFPFGLESADSPDRLAIAQQITSTGASVLAGDDAGPIRYPSDGQMITWLAIALIADDELTGILLLDYHAPTQFWQSDRALWFLFSTRAALALRNATLERQKSTRSRVRELTSKLEGELSPQEVTDTLLDGCKAIFACDTEWVESDAHTNGTTPPSQEPHGSTVVVHVGKKVRHGTLILRRRGDEHFHQSDRELVNLLASQADETLERAFEAERREAFRIAIGEVNRAVSRILKIDEVGNELLKTITSGLGFHFAALQIVDREQDTIEAVAGINAPWADEVVQSLTGNDIQAHVCRGDKPIVVDSLEPDARLDSVIHAKFRHDRVVRVFAPITWKETVVGTIEAGFNREEVAKIGDDVVIVLQSLIASFAERIWESTLAAVLETIAANAMKMVGAQSATIHLGSAPGSGNVHQATAGFIGREFLDAYPPREQEQDALGRRAKKAEDVRWIDDATELAVSHGSIACPEALWARDPQRYPHGHGIKAIACLPLRYGGYEGSLYVHYWRPHKFTQDAADLLKQFGREVERAAANVRLMENARNRSRALTRLVAVGRSLAETRRLPELLPLVANSARSILAADLVTISEFDEVNRAFASPVVSTGVDVNPKSLQGGHRQGDSRLALVDAKRNAYGVDARSDKLLCNTDGRAVDDAPFVIREGIASAAGLLLQARERIVGVLYVNYKRHHEFTAHERTIMEGIASYAALAILRAQGAARQLAEQARAIQAIDLKGGRSVAVDRVLDHIVEKCKEYLGIDDGYVTLQLADRRRKHLVIRASRNLEAPSGEPMRIHGKGITARAARTKSHVIVTDIRAEKDEYVEIKAGMASELAVPLLRDGDLVGVLNVESARSQAFAEPEVAFMTALSRQAVTAITNATIVDRWERMWKALAGIASDTDVDGVYRRIAEIGLEITTADEAVIIPWRERGPEIDLASILHLSMAGADPNLRTMLASMATKLVEAEVACLQSGSAPNSITHLDEGGLPVQAIRVPLRLARPVGNVDYGALWLTYLPDNDLKEEDRAVALTFAEQASFALWSAKEIEKGRQAERLVGINILGGNLIHRASNLLGTIPFNVSVVRKAHDSGNRPLLESTLALLEGEVFKVDKLLGAARIMTPMKTGAWEQLSINDLVRDVIDRASTPARVKIISRLSKTNPRLLSHKGAITGIVENLLANAIKAVEPSGTVTVTTEAKDGEVLVRVEDDGRGIPANAADRIFEPFFSSDKNSLGIGLFVAQRLADDLDGRIDVESGRSRGAAFVIRLPERSNKREGEANVQEAATHR